MSSSAPQDGTPNGEASEPDRVYKGQFRYDPTKPYYHHRKPAGFDGRALCEAQNLDGSLCNAPADKCERHCGAWARALGRACAKFPTKASNALAARRKSRCELHGGKTPMGVASPAFRGAGYSQVLPERLVQKFEENVGSADALSLHEEIALLRTRTQELTESLRNPVGGAVSGEHWGKLKAAWGAFAEAMTAGRIEDAQALSAEIGGLIHGGAESSDVWGEIGETVDKISLVSYREARRIADLDQTMTANQAITLLATIMRSIRTHVSDHLALQRISEDVAILLNKGEAPVVIRRHAVEDKGDVS